MKRYKGFTLVELLVAISIFATIAVVLYSCFRAGIASYRRIESEQGFQQELRSAFNTISRDFKNMVYISVLPFKGDSENTSFVTTLPYSANKKAACVRVSCYLAPSEDNTSYILVRQEEQLADAIKKEAQAFEEAKTEEAAARTDKSEDTELPANASKLLSNISSIKLSYLYAEKKEDLEGIDNPDKESGIAYEWKDFWDTDNILPLAVSIELVIEDPKSKNTFTLSKRVWIPQGKPESEAEKEALEEGAQAEEGSATAESEPETTENESIQQ